MSKPKVITWLPPTLNTDGTAIAAGEITGYELGARLTTDVGSVAGVYPITAMVTDPTATSAPLSVFGTLKAGLYAAAAMAVGPTDSAWSTEASFTIEEIPDAPSGFSVA